ncbi:MAG: porin [Gemmatimonadota bacterium]
MRQLKNRFVVVFAILASWLAASPAAAQEADAPRLSFDAFGTLGFAYSSEDNADFGWNPFQPEGPGHTESISHGLDSRLAGQATLDVTSKLTAIVQVVLERNHEGDYAPRVEWANAGYAITPALTVRAGRLAIPAFMTSDHRKVGFANPWVRPPVELYGTVPVFTIDGVDASYRLHTGAWTTTLGANFGHSHADLPDGSDVDVENAWNTNATIQRGGFTGRIAIAGGQIEIDAFRPLFDGFRAFGPEGAEIADRFEVDGAGFQFLSGGGAYDPGPWFTMTEIAWSNQNSVLGERLAGHLTAGYRWGSLTPYAVYSRTALLSESSDPGLSLEDVPSEQRETAATLNATLNDILRSTPVQQNLAVGGRWDFRPGFSVKLQVDFIDALDDSPGTFINRQAGFEPGGSARLVSLAVDFVF